MNFSQGLKSLVRLPARLEQAGPQLDYIDALRGIAVLAVIMTHTPFYCYPIPSYYLTKLLDQGVRGVQLFYLVSAMTLFLSLSRRESKGGEPVSHFFIRRFFRIAPLFYVMLFIFIWVRSTETGALIHIIGKDVSSLQWQSVLAALTFVNGVHPQWIMSPVPGGWSITVEMMFYCLVPFLFQRIRTLARAGWFFVATVWLAFLLERTLPDFLVQQGYPTGMFMLMYLPAHLPIFAMGIVLYFLLWKSPRLQDSSKREVGGLFLILGIMTALQFSVGGIAGYHLLFSLGWAFLILSLAYFPNRLLVNKLIVTIGRLSFSFYLLHIPVLDTLSHFGYTYLLANPYLNFFFSLFITVLFTFVLSILTYHLIEQPGQHLGRLLIERLKKNRAPRGNAVGILATSASRE